MGKETERKFLVEGDFRKHAICSHHLVQGYISSVPERTVRIRISDDKAYITIKGRGSGNGLSRFEWEKEIDRNEAEELLELCEPGIIDKVRFLVPDAGKTFEVDEFHGANEGLIMAELELDDENEEFEKPYWLGKEVTGDPRYYNSMLSKHPYSEWK